MNQWRLWTYDLKLNKPITATGSTELKRKGAILGLKGADGIWGYGEAANIEDLHEITHEETVAELLQHLKQPQKNPFKKLNPINRCAIDMAKMRFNKQEKLNINGLIAANENAPSQPDRFVGYQTIKIKVSGDPLVEAKRIREISRVIGMGKALRIDANQCWNVKEASVFINGIRSCKLDYIEEPIYDIENLKHLKCPIALDETLWDIGLEACLDYPHLQAVILKPSVIGLEETKHHQKIIMKAGAMPIISSTFESSIGLRALAATASLTKGIVAGLGTCNWFAEDLLEKRMLSNDDRIFNPGMVKADEILYNRLNLVAEK